MVVDPNVELTTGEKRGDAYHIHYWTGLQSPLCIVNEFGKGRAILLNFSVHNAPADQFIGDLLAACGVEPVVKVTGPNGRPVRDVEVTRWANGDARLLALFGTHDGQAIVKLPAAQTVYDLKQHKDLGAVEVFTTELRADRASFFSLHPVPLPAPKVSLSVPELSRGAELAIAVSIPGAEHRSTVQIRAVDPNGSIVPWLAQTVVVGKEPVSVPVSFAVNDPAGKWTLRATELLSHRSTDATVNVR